VSQKTQNKKERTRDSEGCTEKRKEGISIFFGVQQLDATFLRMLFKLKKEALTSRC
jgi:hypothetical protein